MDILGFPDWVPRPERVAGRRKLREMHALANSVIEERQKHGGEGVPDLLDLLLEGEDPETKQRMSLDQLRDNLMTFIVAGHETTALTLSWAIYLMARYPEHQKRARQEAQSVLQGRIAGADDVPYLPFMRQVIDETLRLYPAVAIISRTAMAPDTLCGREVRPKDSVIVPIYALHRSHVLWENPDAFDPSRFENPKFIKRYAYLPFRDGPRICIGASFALQEAIIILATLLSRFEFEMVAGKKPELEMIFTLRPKSGVWVTTKPA
jgi:cytochrome P450